MNLLYLVIFVNERNSGTIFTADKDSSLAVLNVVDDSSTKYVLFPEQRLEER